MQATIASNKHQTGAKMMKKKSIKIHCENSRITESQAHEYVAAAVKKVLNDGCDVCVDSDKITIWSPTGLNFSIPVSEQLALFFDNAKFATECHGRYAHSAFSFDISVPSVGGYLK